MLLVETEGTYTLQQYYDTLDIHVAQSYSVLVTALDRTDAASFFMVAASRFIPLDLAGVALVRYSGFDGPPLQPMPPPLPAYDYDYSFRQALSIRYVQFLPFLFFFYYYKSSYSERTYNSDSL